MLAAAGCASISAASGAQTLRYNFESLSDLSMDPVANLAPGATQNGTLVNAGGKLSLQENQEVLVNSVRYLLGKSIAFGNADAEEGSAGHINTGLNPSGWGMANSNTLNRSYTAMAWVNFGSTAGDNMVFGQLDGDALHLGSRNGNFHSGHWGDDLGPDQGFSVGTGTGAWQHVAWVNDGNAQSIYRNGVLIVGPGATGAGGGAAANMMIGTFRNNGSFVGAIDEVKVFGDQVLTAAQIQTEMTNTLTVVPLAVVTSAKLSNSGFTFTIQDFVPNSIVNTASVELVIDGNLIPTASVIRTKTAGVTTVTYVPTLPDPSVYGSMSSHNYTISAKDQSNPASPNISGSGNLLMPVLPPTVPGPAGTTSTWGLREHRAAPTALGTIGVTVDGLAVLPPADPDPGTNTIFDGAVPVLNHSDPIDPGNQGNFNNDLPFIGGQVGVADNNIAVVGKTQLVIPAAGSYTFSVHTDDGFALRIGGGPVGNTSRFTSSNRATATNGIDGSDPQTIFFSGGAADSSTTGIYNFTAPGTYDVLFVSYEGPGGAFYELAWVPGSFRWDRETTNWTLVGSPLDSSVTAVPFKPRFLTSLPGPAGGNDTWGIRTFYSATVGSTETVSTWLRTTGATRVPDESQTWDEQRNFLNLSDIRNVDTQVLTSQGNVPNDNILPGAVGTGNDSVQNVVTTAKGRIVVTTPGIYTINARGDDGFFLRIKGVNGAPAPSFTRATHPDLNNGSARLEMSNRNEIYYQDGTGDSNTRGIISLAAGQYDLEYFIWQGAGGGWYELSAAAGEFPHGTEPPAGWRPIGLNYTPPSPAGLPQISAAGWTVESSAPGSLATFSIAGAQAALTAGGTTSNADAINFTDPQSGGGPPSPAPAFPWPRNTTGDDDNYAIRATGNLVVTTAGTYRIGYQGDDGGYLIIRGTGGNPNPSWETTLLENATGAGVVEAEDPANAPGILNKIRTEIGTGNSRTIGRITLQPGTYQLEGLMYEGGGGSYWGIVGAIEPVSDTVYYPLSKGGAVPAFSMLPLVFVPVENIPVTNFTYNPATGDYSLTFGSSVGLNYQLEYTNAMEPGLGGAAETWNPVSGTIPGEAGTTTVSGNMNAFKEASGGLLPDNTPRAFLRVRRL